MVVKGLPDSYKAFIAVTTQSENAVQDFAKFKIALKNFEETERARAPNEKSQNKDSILKTRPRQIICHNCGVAGHKSPECKKPKKDKKWCNLHKSSSHSDATCRSQQKHTTNMANSGTGVTGTTAAQPADSTQEHSFVFKVDDQINANNVTSSSSSEDPILVDCGATTHIVNDDKYLIDVDESFNPGEHYIELANGSKSNNVAMKKGTAQISLRDSNNKVVSVKLENTLFIPSYPQCIFSVRAATKKGAQVHFYEDNAMLISNGTCFPIVERSKLYYLYKTSASNARSETLQVWHKLLGHCNLHDVRRLPNVVPDMVITDNSNFDCETCIVSKKTNTRNRMPDARATKPFELIHTDLAGPIDPVAKDGFKYAIIFVDDFSGCTFIYCLKEKSDALKATERFIADVNPYGQIKTFSFNRDIFPMGEVERLRSDNGGEYMSNEFKDLLARNKIRHELSAPYSPHQNGTSERNWRTLFEMARGLLIESKLPKSLWTYALMTASYIRNRCYVQRINSTPFSVITGKKPDLGTLHLFGSVCYPYNHTSTKKLDPRCGKGHFVGYDRNSPSYLVYYPENGKVLKHRIVTFTDKYVSSMEC